MNAYHLADLETIASTLGDHPAATAIRDRVQRIREDDAAQESRNYDCSERQYWDCVESIARDAFDEVGDDDNDADEYIHQAVDGSQWIIYNGRALRVLQYTRNDEAWQDFGDLPRGSHWETITAMAFWAMRGDVFDAYATIVASEYDADIDDDSDDMDSASI